MTLAFILVGLFRRLGEIISQASIMCPADVARETWPESDSRAAFLNASIKYANEFLGINREQFCNWEAEVIDKTKTGEQSVLTNEMLARALVPFARDEITRFFEILEGLKAFERGEVHLKIPKRISNLQVGNHLKTDCCPESGQLNSF